MLSSWQLESLSSEMQGFEQLHNYEAALPYYECQLEVRLLQREPLSPLERMALACAAKGFDSAPAVDFVLGAGLEDSTEALSSLMSLDLLTPVGVVEGTDKSRFRPTTKGFDALASAGFLVPVVGTMRIVYDALLGRVVITPLRKQFLTAADVRRQELHVIPPRHAQPTVNDLDWESLRRFLLEFQRVDPKRAPRGELHDVTRVLRVFRQYRRVDVCAFDSKDHTSLAFRVFDSVVGLKDYDDVLTTLYKQRPEVLPLTTREKAVSTGSSLMPEDLLKLARDRQDELAKLEVVVAEGRAQGDETPVETTREKLDAALRRIRDLQLLLSSEIRVIPVHEHRPLLERALQTAVRRVVIVSPWLNRDAVDEQLEQMIGDALYRGVEVAVGWGITPRDKPDERDKRQENRSMKVVERLRALAKKIGRGPLRAVQLGDTHEKVLLADHSFAVITSFNWLSFRGDPNKVLRREIGLYLGIADHVRDIDTGIMQRIKAREVEGDTPKQ